MDPRYDRLRKRATATWAVRQFFHDRGFLEVDTPTCVAAPAPELQIDAIPVRISTGGGAVADRFLQTSPELAMKRLLAAGCSRIYQIAPVFRDGELGPWHTPEFRLIEWYRRDEDWRALCDDCEALLPHVARALGVGPTITFQGRRIDLAAPFERITVDAAFQRYAGFSVLDALDHDRLAAHLDRLGLHRAAGDDWGDLFHRVFLTRVEPALAAFQRPVLLTHYPAPLCALAKLNADDPRTAERFELYAGGLELANGFSELTRSDEQRRRFHQERELRRRAGKRDYPLDENFLGALGRIESAAGIALGWERTLMLLFDAPTIDDVAFIAWGNA